MTPKSPSDEEHFSRGFHDIPDDDEITKMSFAELAADLSSCEKDSPKFMVIEREIKKHLANDQAKINLPNMLWAAGFGGVFALAGVILGWYLNMTPASEQIPPTSSMQKGENRTPHQKNVINGEIEKVKHEVKTNNKTPIN